MNYRTIFVSTILLLSACVSSSGERTEGFINADIARAYLPLVATTMLVNTRRGAAVVLGPDVAVTVGHNENLLDPKWVIARSSQYDLLFFHPRHSGLPLASATPHLKERVVAYGEGVDGDLRAANGVVTALNTPVNPICATCAMQSAFTFVGDAGPGFSGGPVVDVESGHLLGIVFGYLDHGASRTVYAYQMDLVEEERARIAAN